MQSDSFSSHLNSVRVDHPNCKIVFVLVSSGMNEIIFRIQFHLYAVITWAKRDLSHERMQNRRLIEGLDTLGNFLSFCTRKEIFVTSCMRSYVSTPWEQILSC